VPRQGRRRYVLSERITRTGLDVQWYRDGRPPLAVTRPDRTGSHDFANMRADPRLAAVPWDDVRQGQAGFWVGGTPNTNQNEKVFSGAKSTAEGLELATVECTEILA